MVSARQTSCAAVDTVQKCRAIFVSAKAMMVPNVAWMMIAKALTVLWTKAKFVSHSSRMVSSVRAIHSVSPGSATTSRKVQKLRTRANGNVQRNLLPKRNVTTTECVRVVNVTYVVGGCARARDR